MIFITNVYERYSRIFVTIAGKSDSSRGIHRLVWETLVGEIPKGYDIHHIDLNPLNNDISNLACIPHSAHMQLHKIGVSKSEETRKRMSRGRLGKAHPTPWLSKAVRCIELNKEYSSASAAARELSLNVNAVANSIRLKHKSGGYHWEYVT